MQLCQSVVDMAQLSVTLQSNKHVVRWQIAQQSCVSDARTHLHDDEAQQVAQLQRRRLAEAYPVKHQAGSADHCPHLNSAQQQHFGGVEMHGPQHCIVTSRRHRDVFQLGDIEQSWSPPLSRELKMPSASSRARTHGNTQLPLHDGTEVAGSEKGCGYREVSSVPMCRTGGVLKECTRMKMAVVHILATIMMRLFCTFSISWRTYRRSARSCRMDVISAAHYAQSNQ